MPELDEFTNVLKHIKQQIYLLHINYCVICKQVPNRICEHYDGVGRRISPMCISHYSCSCVLQLPNSLSMNMQLPM